VTEAADPVIEIDVVRTALQRRFFDMFSFDTPDELLAAIGGLELDVDALARCRDVRDRLADGWVYWLLFTKGWLQYRSAGSIGEGNVYFDYLYRHYLAHGHNPAMRADLDHPQTAAERVRRRYADLDLLVRMAAGDDGASVAPILVTVSDPPAPHPYPFYAVGADEPVPVRAIDGWHRMCSAQLAGWPTLRCTVVQERLTAASLQSAIDRFTCEGGAVTLSGWWLDPDRPIYNYELRLDGRTIGSGTPVRRPDIAEAHPDVVHAAWSGFSLCADLPAGAGPGELVLVGFQDIVPVGALRPMRPGQAGQPSADLVVSETG